MEIEELQATWQRLSDELEQQKTLTQQMIMQMTQERYSNKFKTVSIYETIGAIICFITGTYFLINFAKLDTWYLMACGAFSTAFLFGMPILVLNALKKIKTIDILKNDYRETLILYAKAKKNLLMLQELGIYASFLLMFSTTAVFSKIWSNKDFFLVERSVWVYASIVVAVLFLVFFSRWGYRCYKNITNSAEEILNNLEN